MRIPDETLYEYGEGFEDKAGWVCCLQCKYCPLTNQSTIYEDGRFWCSAFKQWRRGDDILEYRCENYRQKQCSNCGNTSCDLRVNRDFEMMDKISFCDNYVLSHVRWKQKRFYGRRVLTGYMLTKKTLELEEEYADRKLKEIANEYTVADDKASRVEETRKHIEKTWRNEKVGFIPLSNSDEANKVSWNA